MSETEITSTSVRMPTEYYEILRTLAFERRTSINQLMLDAIAEKYLGKEDNKNG